MVMLVGYFISSQVSLQKDQNWKKKSKENTKKEKHNQAVDSLLRPWIRPEMISARKREEESK